MISEIKKEIESNNIMIGYKEVIKGLNKGLIKKIFYANNLEEDRIKELTKYSKLSSIDFINSGIPNDELGIICKKSYFISVLAIKK